jgi:hypothetical protein
MRAFLLACLVTVVIGAGGYFTLASMQKSTGVAFATDGARINPQWTWRSMFRKTKTPAAGGMTVPGAPSELVDECDTRTASQWIFVDFGTPDGEADLCSISQ